MEEEEAAAKVDEELDEMGCGGQGQHHTP